METLRAAFGRIRLRRGSWPPAIPVGVVLLVVATLDLRGLPGAFLSDDMAHLNVIAAMDRDHALVSWLLARFIEPLGSGNFAYRPLAFLSYALEWKLFGAMADAWRLSNLALHVAATALVYTVARRWTRSSQPPSQAVWAASIFAAFPLAGEVVFWPAARADLLAACFGLLFLATLRPCRQPASGSVQRWRALALVAALLAKESAIPLPFVAVAIQAALTVPTLDRSERPRGWAALRCAARDLAAAFAVLAAYLAWRIYLFGTALKVYPASTLPSSVVEYAERLRPLVTLVQAQPGLHPPWLWAAVAGALLLALTLAQSARAASVTARGLALALMLAALAYVLAPALSFAAATENGDGARNYYMAWIYVALGLGFVAGATVVTRGLAVAFVAWMLLAQHGSQQQWHAAAREMRRVQAAVPMFAATVPADGYALLFLPDHIGVALFARNAEGAIVNRPVQASDHLSVVAGMTEADLPGWRENFATGAIAKLKGSERFAMDRFAGVYCWNPAQAAFVPVSPGGPIADFDAWQHSTRVGALRAGCLAGTVSPDR